ncbi:hypothetical protein FGO68_gene2610 [Halteria grandinella]|uniref:Uncharacterized protein n=1 Tax=Halteria grandinella TaxID=5974 RepID=A0A8J8NTD2_HALGN|nr:hypothetical protein FGO68_gene2610 [Halteria grandinella]
METYQPQEDLTVSMTKITLDKSESMQECSEHPKEKVMFHCLEPSCTYFNIQDLYCLLCSQDRHPHKIMPIELHRKNIGDQWNIERQNVRVLISNIREMLEHFSDLVTIFEELIPDKKRGLKSVEMRLECLGQEMEDFYQENVAQLINSNNVVGLQQQSQKFNNFKEKLEDFDILREPTAKVFWKIYSDHVFKVTIFDSFYKLKPQSMTLLLKLQMQRVMLALLQLRNMVILDQFEQLQESDGPAMLITLSLQKQMLDQFDTSTASQSDLARVAQLRSDLDIIGMAFILVRQQQQFTDQIEKLKVELDQRQQPLLKDYYFVQQSIVETRGNQETKGELATSQIVPRPEIAQSNTAGNEEEKKEGILTPTGYTPDRPQISKSFDSLILDSDNLPFCLEEVEIAFKQKNSISCAIRKVLPQLLSKLSVAISQVVTQHRAGMELAIKQTRTLGFSIPSS